MTVTSRRALAALATATVLGASALAVPAFAADAPGKTGEAPKTVLKEGTLEWGVKESFRKYLMKPLAHGEIKVADGAKQAEKNGVFTFTGGGGKQDPSSQSIATTFKGSVHFLGHPKRGSAGFDLDITLADLKVVTDAKSGGKKGSITADVTAGDGKKQDDVPIAALDLSGVKPVDGADGVKTYAKIPAKLTAEGVKVFTYDGTPYYDEGEDLDPATLSVKESAEEPPKKDEGTQTDEGAKSGEGSKSGEGTKTGEGSKTENKTGTAIFDGNLDWGVKKKFRDYLAKPATEGKTEVADGTQKSGDNFRFVQGKGSYDATAGTLNATFAGSVRFTGHKGQMDLKFSNFKVTAQTSDKSGTLSADVSAKDPQTGKTNVTTGMPLAKLQLTADALKAKDGIVSLWGAPATLTAEGAKVFMNYEKGEALDPVTVRVAVDKNAKLPTDQAPTGSDSGTGSGTGTGTSGSTGSTGSGTTATNTANTTGGAATTGGTGATTGDTTPLASTGASTPTGPLLGAAGALVLAGGGAVFATRRRGRGPAQG
ncbi:HtaA domain-containing protein [Streptomyces klenkii]|uniref:HtaA domain-containing protein n=1 Tax=Streptomyces klenkii TaxID=1420899 RepID=UPI0033FE3B98